MIKILDTLRFAGAISEQMGIAPQKISTSSSEAMISWLNSHHLLCAKVTRLGISGREVNTLQALKWFPNITHLIVYGGNGKKREGVCCGEALNLTGIHEHCKKLKDLFIMNGTEDVDLSDLSQLEKIHLIAHGVVSKPVMNLTVKLPLKIENTTLSGYHPSY